MINKSTKTSKISAVFLAAVLTAGMFALSSPSFMTGAEAYPYNNNNDNDHKDKFKYKPSFDKSFKKSSSSAQFNKCVNVNINIPGLDITFPQTTAEALAASSSSDGPNGGNHGPNGPDGISFDKNQVFVCINNNDNRITGGVDGGDGDDTPTCLECLLKLPTEVQQQILIAILDVSGDTIQLGGVTIDISGVTTDDNLLLGLTQLCEAIDTAIATQGPIEATQEEIEDFLEDLGILADVQDTINCLVEAGILVILPPP